MGPAYSPLPSCHSGTSDWLWTPDAQRPRFFSLERKYRPKHSYRCYSLGGAWGGCKPLPSQLFWAQRPANPMPAPTGVASLTTAVNIFLRRNPQVDKWFRAAFPGVSREIDPSDYAPKELIVQSSDREISLFSQRFLAVSKMFTAVPRSPPRCEDETASSAGSGCVVAWSFPLVAYLIRSMTLRGPSRRLAASTRGWDRVILSGKANRRRSQEL